MSKRTETFYARSGDLAIAYQVVGNGPLELVFVPGFISHVELNWEVPFLAPMLERLASFSRLLVLDKRGHGLSDRLVGAGTLEDRMADVRAVMDAAAFSRAALLGISEGGPLAMLFAATYPERVSSLVLYGTFARLCRVPGYQMGIDPNTIEQLAAQIEGSWGTGETLGSMVQHVPDPVAVRPTLARFERFTTTPAVAANMMRLHIDTDVRTALTAISAPTLVVHCEGDRTVPRSLGRYIADHIPGARWVEIPGDFHSSWLAEDQDSVVDPIEMFLMGTPCAVRPPRSERMLATLLFTDIVESTTHAAALGDARWCTILDAHNRAIREELERWRGIEVKTTGDGFLASFDGPARAVHCALAVVQRAHQLGIDVRCGVHTGECEVREHDLSGLAIHTAARVVAAAAPGEVLVTVTLKDLVVGSDLLFDDRGVHTLKGIPGKVQLYAAR